MANVSNELVKKKELPYLFLISSISVVTGQQFYGVLSSLISGPNKNHVEYGLKKEILDRILISSCLWK